MYIKLFINCGKLNGNDITDALIIAATYINEGSSIKEYIILTEDERVKKFLQKENEYNEEIYNKFVF